MREYRKASVFNRKTMKHEDHLFDVVVDIDAILKRLGAQALNSKTQKSAFMNGMVTVKRVIKAGP